MESISKNLTNPKLYQQISDFSIDEPTVALPFSQRLARENHWSRNYSLRVLDEYKRFAYLCIAAGHPCTPSDEVDQAWHLHMLYTSSYFDRFCKEVLGKTLAHEPTKGGQDEGEKFTDWYEKTKESYRREFGELPPDDIWPSSEVRFQPTNFARVNTKEYWLIPKLKLNRATLPLIATAGILVLIGCTTASQGFDGGAVSAGIIICLAIFGVIALLLIIRAQTGGNKNRNHHAGGCATAGCGGDSYGASGTFDSSGGDGGSGCGSSGCGGGGGCGGGCGGGD